MIRSEVGKVGSWRGPRLFLCSNPWKQRLITPPDLLFQHYKTCRWLQNAQKKNLYDTVVRFEYRMYVLNFADQLTLLDYVCSIRRLPGCRDSVKNFQTWKVCLGSQRQYCVGSTLYLMIDLCFWSPKRIVFPATTLTFTIKSSSLVLNDHAWLRRRRDPRRAISRHPVLQSKGVLARLVACLQRLACIRDADSIPRYKSRLAPHEIPLPSQLSSILSHLPS